MDTKDEILKTLKITGALWKQKHRLDELGVSPFDPAYDAIQARMRHAYRRLEVAAQSIPGNQYIIGSIFNLKILG